MRFWGKVTRVNEIRGNAARGNEILGKFISVEMRLGEMRFQGNVILGE
jgi:hypothetical protein